MYPKMSATKIAQAAIIALGFFLPCQIGLAEQDLIVVKAKNFKAYGPWPRIREWTDFNARTIPMLHGFNPSSSKISLSKYGGLLSKSTEQKGFFYVKKNNGRWWLVDPQGCYFLSMSVNNFGDTNSPADMENMLKLFGSFDNWAIKSVSMLREKGFNTVTSDGKMLRESQIYPMLSKVDANIAYTLTWQFLPAYGRAHGFFTKGLEPGNPKAYIPLAIPVFNPDFEEFCDHYAAENIAKFKKDPWLIGHFSDNEIYKNMDMLDRNLKLNPSDPNTRFAYEAAKTWFTSRHPDSNAAINDINDSDRKAFLGHVFDRYYSITTRAIRKYDPNHLCLGSRLHDATLLVPDIFRAAGKYLDVVSVNYYATWRPTNEMMQMWTAESGRPFAITEFYTKGNDVSTGNSKHGAGWLVPTQADRGLFYQNFALALLESHNCVGWHWFRYRDPSSFEPNKGIVDANCTPYGPLVDQMSYLNKNAYELAAYFDAQTH